MDSLTLSADFDPDDGSVELRCRVQSAGFAGTGAAWFTTEDLEAFCASLATYPIDANTPVLIEGGYWDSAHQLTDTHLSIRIAPHNNVGALQVRVQLAEPKEYGHPRNVRTWFVVGYNDLDGFRSALAKVLSGNAEEAILSSTLV